jgi:hypothetical protein
MSGSGRIRASPAPAAQGFAFGRCGLLFLEPVTLGAQGVNLVEHPIEQRVRLDRGYPGPLQLPDLAALPVDLCPHSLDFAPNVLDVRHDPYP